MLTTLRVLGLFFFFFVSLFFSYYVRHKCISYRFVIFFTTKITHIIIHYFMTKYSSCISISAAIFARPGNYFSYFLSTTPTILRSIILVYHLLACHSFLS